MSAFRGALTPRWRGRSILSHTQERALTVISLQVAPVLRECFVDERRTCGRRRWITGRSDCVHLGESLRIR